MALGEARSEQQLDNGHVRVTRWTFPPQSETGHHVHQYDYVVVPVVPGTLTMANEDGTTNEATLSLGVSYARAAGVSHNVMNLSDAEVAFVEIELLDRPLSA